MDNDEPKGKTIGFKLTLSQEQSFEALADAAGLSPGKYAGDLALRHLQGDLKQQHFREELERFENELKALRVDLKEALVELRRDWYSAFASLLVTVTNQSRITPEAATQWAEKQLRKLQS